MADERLQIAANHLVVFLLRFKVRVETFFPFALGAHSFDADAVCQGKPFLLVLLHD